MTRNKFYAVCIFACVTLMTICLQSCIQLPGKQLVINEVCGKEFPDNEWVEIYNPTDSVVKLKGIYLIKVDENGIDHELFRFKSGELAPGHARYVLRLRSLQLLSRSSAPHSFIICSYISLCRAGSVLSCITIALKRCALNVLKIATV